MATHGRRRTPDEQPNRAADARHGRTAAEPDNVIARRAYELYEARGGEPGHDWEDWFQAESELRSGTRREDR